MTNGDGLNEKMRALERDIQGVERDLERGSDERGKMWDRLTKLERDFVGVGRDVGALKDTVQRVERAVGEVKGMVQDQEERHDKNTRKERELTAGQKTAIIAGSFVVIAAFVQALATLIQAGAG